MGRARRHVFVCTQQRPLGGRPACGLRGGTALLAALREAVARRADLWDVAVTGCECLGPCFDGPNAVVYPEGVWYSGAAAGDADAIVDQHLADGRPVSRLIRWSADTAVGEDEDDADDKGDEPPEQ